MNTNINYYGIESECAYLEHLIAQYLDDEEECEFLRGLIFGISGALMVMNYIDYNTYKYIMKLMGV